MALASSSRDEMDAYGSFVEGSQSAVDTVYPEAKSASSVAVAERRSSTARSAAIWFGGMAVGVALGGVLFGGGDVSGAAANLGALSTDSAAKVAAAPRAALEPVVAAAAVAAVDAATPEMAPQTPALYAPDMQFSSPTDTVDKVAEAAAAKAAPTPGPAVLSYSAEADLQRRFATRQSSDNNRWSEADVAAWKCCAYVVEGKPINSPPFSQPKTITSSDGELKTELKVTQARQNGPISFNTRGYNGDVPGPTLIAKRGDWLKIDFTNSLEFPTQALPAAYDHAATVKLAIRTATGECMPYGEPNVTSLHVHGLHTNTDGYGDYPLKMAHPGETVPYYLYIREDHPTGTFWYHPHSKDGAAMQEAGMMAGAMIVEDDDSAWTEDLADLTDRVFLFQWVDSNHNFDNYTFMSKCSGSNMALEYNKHSDAGGNNYVTINGQYLPEVDIGTNEYQRWRYINAISHAFLNLTVVDDFGWAVCETWEIAADGVYYHQSRSVDKVFVTLGGRKDIIIGKCREAGLYTLLATQKHPSQYSDPNEFSGSVASVRVYESDDGVEIDIGSAELPSAGLYDRSIANSPVQNKYDVVISNWYDTPTEWFTMNDIVYDGLLHNRIQLDALQEWTIRQDYDSSAAEFTNHNWHLHTHHFQVVGSSDIRDQTEDWKLYDWRDTVNVPPGGWIKVRFLPENYGGLLLHHCHVFNHETAGMKQLVSVVNCSDEGIYEGLRHYSIEEGASDDFCTYTHSTSRGGGRGESTDDDDTAGHKSHSGLSTSSKLNRTKSAPSDDDLANQAAAARLADDDKATAAAAAPPFKATNHSSETR